jgi:hypothetical protein
MFSVKSTRHEAGDSPGAAPMPFRNTSLAVAAGLLFAAPAVTFAACTPKQQEAKINQVNAIIAPLAQKDPARAQQVREGLHQALLLDGDEICVSLDKLIEQGK